MCTSELFLGDVIVSYLNEAFESRNMSFNHEKRHVSSWLNQVFLLDVVQKERKSKLIIQIIYLQNNLFLVRYRSRRLKGRKFVEM